MKKQYKILSVSLSLFLAFIVWTLLVRFVDVNRIGPDDSRVGFAVFNALCHRITGVNMTLYVITDWLGLVPVGVGIGFAIFGLCQWIKRGKIQKVDFSLLVLGGFYIVTLIFYLFFEEVVINYRPTLINGSLEASYPSSTTLLVTCVMPTAIMQFKTRIKNTFLRRSVNILIIFFVVFMVTARFISGVHWVTDIIGGLLLAASLVTAYCFIACGKK